jgi:small subunit ribosomal protein S6
LETTTVNKLYEGMFLVDSALANTDWDGIVKTIKTILEKADSEIVSLKKWDDRKLTYNIRSVARGTYILCYFKVNGGKISEIENAVRLSDQIIRVLILNAEQINATDMEKETPAELAEKLGTPPQNEEPEEPEKTEQSDETEHLEEAQTQETAVLEQDFEAEDEDVEETEQPS